LARGLLDPAQQPLALEHLDACPTCRRLVAVAAKSLDAGHGEPPTLLRPGETFARYVIVEPLGAGAMGVVYAARDAQLGRRVALKLLRSESSPVATAHGRVLREAKAAASLSHPNVIVVYEVGEAGGCPFLAMELVDGGSLREWLSAAPRTVDERLAMFLQAGEGLAAAHDAGVVHRDLKPDNILVGADGRPRIADFGLAWQAGAPADGAPRDASREAPAAVDSAPSCTTAVYGRLVGTPAYMSPEQLRGERADARSDQYAFAVSVREALQGKRPSSPSAALPRLTDPRVPWHVRAALRRATADDPQARFPNMRAFLEALRQPRRPPWRWQAATAGVFVASVAVADARTPHEARPAAPREESFALAAGHPRRMTFGECDEFPVFTPDGTALVYSAVSGRVEHIVATALATGEEQAITHGDGWDLAPSISPDGRLVAYLHSDDTDLATYVVDVEGAGPPRRIAAGGTRPRFSRDGTAVWAGRKARPSRYDLASLEATEVLESPPNAAAPQLRELADGSTIASYPDAGRSSATGIALFAPSGALTWLARTPAEEVLAVAPNGLFVVAARKTSAHNTELLAVATAGGRTAPLPLTDVHAVKGLDFAPDGRRVAWSACEGLVTVGRYDERSTFVPLDQPTWHEPAAAPVGRTGAIAVLSERSGTPALWIVDAHDPQAPRLVWSADPLHRPNDLDVSPDGALAVVELSDTGLLLVDLHESRSRPLTTGPTDSAARFSRDGTEVFFTRTLDADVTQVLAIAVGDGRTRVVLEPTSRQAAPSPVDTRVAYLSGSDFARRLPKMVDTATGRSRRISPSLPEGRYMSLAFSPDGRRIGAIAGEGRIIEVDASTGKLLRSFDTGDVLQNLHYVEGDPWVGRAVTRGNVWMADLDEPEATSFAATR
jgi:serine/threonine-protein kinase